MKILSVLIFAMFTLFSIAQPKQIKLTKQVKQKKQSNIPLSKTLVGIWRQTGVQNRYSGGVIDVLSGNYMVYNSDGTFYSFIAWNEASTTIGQYGSYDITSDSILVEHIVDHFMNAKLAGKDCAVRYKFIDENNAMMGWSFDRVNWMDERWKRLPLERQDKKPVSKTPSTSGATTATTF